MVKDKMNLLWLNDQCADTSNNCGVKEIMMFIIFHRDLVGFELCLFVCQCLFLISFIVSENVLYRLKFEMEWNQNCKVLLSFDLDGILMGKVDFLYDC